MLIDLGQVNDFEKFTKVTSKKEMLSASIRDGRWEVKINNSSLVILQECYRKAKYALKDGYFRDVQSDSLIFGVAFHAALEEFYKADPSERVLPKHFEKLMEFMGDGGVCAEEQDFLVLRAARKFIESAQPLSHLPSSDKRSIQNGIWILTEYFKIYKDDPYKILHDENGPIIERRIEYNLYDSKELKIDFFGTIDAVFQDIHTGDILVADHKTTSLVGQQFYNRLKPNHQYTGYILGAKKVLGIDTNKFLVNCIEVKSKPKTSRGKGPNFPRQITSRDEEDFKEFKDTVKFYVNMYVHCLMTDTWPQGGVNACAMYSGCQYHEICQAPNKIKNNIIEANFKRKDEL